MLVLAALAACGNTASVPTATMAPDAHRGDADGAVPTAKPSVVFVHDGAESAVSVALALIEEQRRRGLMYVQNLPPDDGMLFVFDADAELSFWMKNTLIALDMIFIDSGMTVVGVIANAKPLTLEPRGVGKPARFVVEVNGGWAAAHGVAAGTKVRFDNFPR
jgi:uncharacterized membrane protein (UPF0127 family)